MNEKGVTTLATFAVDDEERKRQKKYFYKGSAQVKITTVHSFKGWEGRALVIAVGGNASRFNRELIYTALTRLKRHPDGSYLTVVCATQELTEFGATWPS